MNQQNQRTTSFRRFFGQTKLSSIVSSNAAHTIPRESLSTFYSKCPDISPNGSAMRGWLKRQSVGLVKSWQTRWFVLSGDYLSYYSSEDVSKSQSGRIYLPGHSITEHPFGEQQKYIFELSLNADRSSSRSHLLCADSEEERREWVKHIKEVLYGRKGGAIFGRPLETTLSYERKKNKNRKVPELVQMCVEFLQANGLEAEGLFRLPGRTVLVKQLKNAFDTGERLRMDLTCVDVHSAASLLKAYLRELPGPLIPIKFYDPVMHIVTRELELYPDESVEKLAKVISDLPLANYNLLHYLCCFLHEVGQRSEVNRMTEMNLATVFAQSFIEPEDDDPALLMGTADNRSKAAFVLISQVTRIFTGRVEENEKENEENGTKKGNPFDFCNEHFEAVNGPGIGVCSGNTAGFANKAQGAEFLSCDDWMIVDKNCVDDVLTDNSAFPWSADRTTQRTPLRRSASLGDYQLIGVSYPGETPEMPSPAADKAGDPAQPELILDGDPTRLDHKELVDLVLCLQEELLKQRLACSNLTDELNALKRKHLEKVRMMAERLNVERSATSEAVSRIVQVQTELEKYHLKYGPL